MTRDIATFIKEGYNEGIDVCHDTALFEYGLLHTAPRDGYIEVVYGVDCNDGGDYCKFLESSFDLDDLTLEYFNWIDDDLEELKELEKSIGFLHHIHLRYSHLDVYGCDHFNYPFSMRDSNGDLVA